jgi:hypothetical protein
MPSSRRRTPSSAARKRPRSESRPLRQPVAISLSLASLIEWVSKTS